MNKQQLAAKIWESANKMRSKIEASEYKDYMLGFMFYKFLSDNQVKFLKDKNFSEEDIIQIDENDKSEIKFIQNGIGYFISYNNLFSTWVEKGSDFDVSHVRDALNAFDRYISTSHKKVFDRVFNTLQTGLSKLGGTSTEQTKAIRDLIHLLKIIPMNGRQDYDILGFIYESLISNFASIAGKKAGEFYTPHEVSLLMSEIVADHLKDKESIKIYDPTSGSGSLLINIGNSVAKHMDNRNNIKYYAQELKENTYNLTRMNLVMRGILPDNIAARNGDTLENDWPFFEDSDPVGTYDPLYVDAVVSNPPYSQNWDRDNKESDARYSEYGLAPKSKADYAFLLHDLFHVKSDGIMTIVLPHGVLFRGGEEAAIRKNLIEKNQIDTIIGLPSNIFFGTGIPTIIMVLKKEKKIDNNILIIDASKGFIKSGNKNELRSSDIKKITDTVIERKTVEKYSKLVSLDEIRENDYNLNIPRYVDSPEETEKWDIHSIMFGGFPKTELNILDKYWSVFPSLKNQLFDEVNEDYLQIKKIDISTAVKNNEEIVEYFENFAEKLKDLKPYLTEKLIYDMTKINISKEEQVVSLKVFEKIKPFSLLDEYKAYQIFKDFWDKIAIDLEIINTEGAQAINVVDPNMVSKKKNNKEVEIQEGWLGRIIPFELVQSTILKKEFESISTKKNRLYEISSEYQGVIENLNEEDKETILKDSGEIDFKKVKDELKDIDDTVEGYLDLKTRFLKIISLNNEEKDLKKLIKKENSDLTIKTKETIESLSMDDAKKILIEKWVNPLIVEILKLPEEIINSIVNKVKSIKDKYDVTFLEIEDSIKKEKNDFLSLLNEIEGEEYDMKGISELKSLLKGD